MAGDDLGEADVRERDRRTLAWVYDLIDDAAGASGEYRFCKRVEAAKRLLARLMNDGQPARTIELDQDVGP